MASKTRNELSLAQRVAVIEHSRKNPTHGSRKLAEHFQCGRTQIQSILKNKDAIMAEYEADSIPSSRKRHRPSAFDDINEAMYKWYSLARQRSVPVSGPMLQEEARLMAQKLDHAEGFKASNGWLESFKKRHNIRQFTISGESADVSEETVQDWYEKLNVLMDGYKAEDIWNADETGCFYRALPDKTLSDMNKQCKGGKKAKERVTVCLFANAHGEKELPIVIGRAANPRCFKGIRNPKMPGGIPYYSNAKAWMTTDIMTSILSSLNRRLIRKNRHILLLLDNATSHDSNLKDKFSNIKIVFLPKNTTSKLQPLDAGVIKNFKVHYRRLLLQHTLSCINESDLSTSSIVKTINILMAIRWIRQAWDEVKPETIMNCFRHCGALPPQNCEQEDSLMLVEDLELEEVADTEEDTYLQQLVSQFDPNTTIL